MVRNGKICLLAAVMALLLLLTACGHEHTWAAATCTEPETCTDCGETQGEPLGHTWAEATCTEPETCTKCGETKGEPVGHVWSTDDPQICTVCGEAADPAELQNAPEDEEEDEETHNNDAADDAVTEEQRVEDDLRGAMEALSEYWEKTGGLEHGDLFKEYAAAYQIFLERYQASHFGAKDYQAAIDLLIPQESLQEMGYDYVKAGKALASDFWQTVFAANGEDYGQNFINLLYEMGKGAEELGVYFEEVGDGTMDVFIDDFGQLADGLGVTEDFIISVFDALSIFGPLENVYASDESKPLNQFIE